MGLDPTIISTPVIPRRDVEPPSREERRDAEKANARHDAANQLEAELLNTNSVEINTTRPEAPKAEAHRQPAKAEPTAKNEPKTKPETPKQAQNNFKADTFTRDQSARDRAANLEKGLPPQQANAAEPVSPTLAPTQAAKADGTGIKQGDHGPTGQSEDPATEGKSGTRTAAQGGSTPKDAGRTAKGSETIAQRPGETTTGHGEKAGRAEDSPRNPQSLANLLSGKQVPTHQPAALVAARPTAEPSLPLQPQLSQLPAKQTAGKLLPTATPEGKTAEGKKEGLLAKFLKSVGILKQTPATPKAATPTPTVMAQSGKPTRSNGAAVPAGGPAETAQAEAPKGEVKILLTTTGMGNEGDVANYAGHLTNALNFGRNIMNGGQPLPFSVPTAMVRGGKKAFDKFSSKSEDKDREVAETRGGSSDLGWACKTGRFRGQMGNYA